MDIRIAEDDTSYLNCTDLYIYQCGSEACESGHSYGPATRDHFLIHYIHSGKGIFQMGDTTYHLKAGNGFLICPDIVTYYQADILDPWHYSWIGFHGLKAEAYLQEAGLSLEHPVFEYLEDDFIDKCFYEMSEAYFLRRGSNVRRLAYLYLFLDKLIQTNQHSEITPPRRSKNGRERNDAYVNDTLRFIETNYSRKITVEMISNHVGLNRSYLNSIFKDALGKSIQQYQIEFRVRKACELLGNSTLSISTVSRSVGYSDPLLFSKVFKRIQGVTPTEYKKNLQQTHEPE